MPLSSWLGLHRGVKRRTQQLADTVPAILSADLLTAAAVEVQEHGSI